jgi:hypothetical protein
MFTDLKAKNPFVPDRSILAKVISALFLTLALLTAGCGSAGTNAMTGNTSNVSGVGSSAQVRTVFVIAMENHNWTQPFNQFTGGTQQIYQNPSAPFINSLVSGTAVATVGGASVNISQQVAYATAYHNVLATSSGDIPGLHPSEPNYIWAEAGIYIGTFNDNDPYAGGANQASLLHLSALLAAAGKNWKSYQEDIDLAGNGSGQITNVPLGRDQWNVPLTSFSGTLAAGSFNAYNGSNQYSYAAKHNPMLFFTDTNGGNNSTPSNPLSAHYAPLQQLLVDLSVGSVADYNWITPNLNNDMHSALAGGYKGLTGDQANIKQGDDFLKQLIPTIMASAAYKNQGAIIVWWDETESTGATGERADDFKHTLGEIVISPLAHPNVNGAPYASPVNLTHSSDLRTMQQIFGVGPLLSDATLANDLSDLFAPGAIPSNP